MVMVHSTVAWVFGLMVSRPAWYGAILAPYFLLGAVLSGLAAIVIVSAIYRHLFGWEAFVKVEAIRGLCKVLSWLSVGYLYFQLAEYLTVGFAGPLGDLRVTQAATEGSIGWAQTIQLAGLSTATIIFLVNTIFPTVFRIGTTVFASVLIVVALWATRLAILVPSQIRPYLPYARGDYEPTWVECSLVGGTFALMILLYALFTKVFPIVSLSELEQAEARSHES